MTVHYPQVARVEPVPVRQLPGEPMHRVLDRPERVPGTLRIAHPTQQPQSEVVEGHIAQVCAGIRKARLHTGIGGEAVEYARTMVGDGGAPVDPCAVRSLSRAARPSRSRCAATLLR